MNSAIDTAHGSTTNRSEPAVSRDVWESTRAANPPSPSLSLVIPAFNEAIRIASTLETALAYLAEQPYRSELILVDDGSTDGTTAIARRLLDGQANARLLSIRHGGKAAALRAGMLAATNDQIAFCDADLATPLVYLEELRAALANGDDIAIGSREGVGARRVGEPLYRHLMGRVFNLLVRILLLPEFQDTQCGFKLFRRQAAREILQRARLYAEPGTTVAGARVTAFDVELLVIARQLGYRIRVAPVVWTYGSRGKVHPIRDTWFNLRDVLLVRLNAWRGHYD
jgi:glycosyltransferase involved in cell wall biosynthesis